MPQSEIRKQRKQNAAKQLLLVFVVDKTRESKTWKLTN